MDNDRGWPSELAVRQVRVARPTDRLDAVFAFYRDDLGLPELGRFAGHAGYTGVVRGPPGVERIVARLADRGHPVVDAENPYWPAIGATTFTPTPVGGAW